MSLSSISAENNRIDGSLGFYLAADLVAAEFVAYRRVNGTILQYNMTGPALRSLLAGGSMLGPIPQGAFPTSFPGQQLVVPPAQLGQFNALRGSGAIVVTPYRGGQ